MILVDTSVWVEYFTRPLSVPARRLEQLLEKLQDVVTLDLILAEALRGFKRDSEFNETRSLLSRLDSIELSRESHIAAADLYRYLRKKGVTVRGIIDCLIAQACLESEAALFTLDRDFSSIARHTNLKLL